MNSEPTVPMNQGLSHVLLALAIAALTAAYVSGAENDSPPVPTLHVTDLFRPHNDPDDHWDLACQYSLAYQGKVDLRGVMIDHPKPEWPKAPDICAVAQMNWLTGKAVPVTVGTPSSPSESEMVGIRAFHDWMRQSPKPVVIHILGSCRDVALAARLEPELFARKCAAVYLNAGSGTPDSEKAKRLEYNVALDPVNYAAIFELPCPVYWLPCFEWISPVPAEMWRVAEYGSYYRFRQSEILPQLSVRLQNYFLAMYAGGKPANGLWLQQLSLPIDPAALKTEGDRNRNMWCTAGFLHAARLTVATSGEIVPLNSVTSPVFAFEPIRVTCAANGVTTWSRDADSKNRFILRVTDVERYQAAMTAALRSLVESLPQ